MLDAKLESNWVWHLRADLNSETAGFVQCYDTSKARSVLGGELLETTPENYRQIVSRARRLVDPESLRFDLPYLHTIREFVAEKAPIVDAAVQMKPSEEGIVDGAAHPGLWAVR